MKNEKWKQMLKSYRNYFEGYNAKEKRVIYYIWWWEWPRWPESYSETKDLPQKPLSEQVQDATRWMEEWAKRNINWLQWLWAWDELIKWYKWELQWTYRELWLPQLTRELQALPEQYADLQEWLRWSLQDFEYQRWLDQFRLAKPEWVDMTNEDWNRLHPEEQEYIVNWWTDVLIDPINLIASGLVWAWAVLLAKWTQIWVQLVFASWKAFLKWVTEEVIPLSISNLKEFIKIAKEKWQAIWRKLWDMLTPDHVAITPDWIKVPINWPMMAEWYSWWWQFSRISRETAMRIVWRWPWESVNLIWRNELFIKNYIELNAQEIVWKISKEAFEKQKWVFNSVTEYINSWINISESLKRHIDEYLVDLYYKSKSFWERRLMEQIMEVRAKYN